MEGSQLSCVRENGLGNFRMIDGPRAYSMPGTVVGAGRQTPPPPSEVPQSTMENYLDIKVEYELLSGLGSIRRRSLRTPMVRGQSEKGSLRN